jgi:hypothetical protein
VDRRLLDLKASYSPQISTPPAPERGRPGAHRRLICTESNAFMEISTRHGGSAMRYRNRLATTRERIIAVEIRKLELRQARQHADEAVQPSVRSSSARRSR